MDKKIYLLIAVLVVALAGWYVGDANAVPPPDLPGPFSVGHTSHTFYDASRDRELLTEVWYPVDPGDESGYDITVYNLGKAAPKKKKIKFDEVEITSGDTTATQAYEGPPISSNGPLPLVVYSSGTTGFPIAAYHVNEALASHGFIVASVHHTGWTIIEFALGTRDPVTQTRLDRPPDIVVVLDEMLARYDIDPDRIGMIGCSFGAYTAFALAGGIENLGIEADGRLKAIIGYGSAQIGQFSLEDFDAIDIPSLLLGGTRDVLAPIEFNHLRTFAEMSGNPRYRVDMVDAAHDAWVNGCEWGEAALDAGVTALSDIFLRDAVECHLRADPEDPPLNLISRAEAMRLARVYTVSFMQTYVAGVGGYRPFLTQDYADTEPNAEIYKCTGGQDGPYDFELGGTQC